MTRLIKSKSEMHNTWWIVPVGNIGQIKAKATAKKGLALSLSMESHLNSMQSHMHDGLPLPCATAMGTAIAVILIREKDLFRLFKTR